MDHIPRASVKQLAHKIKGFGKHPRMALLLGAGASRQSGIITAGEMIRVFKERVFGECCPDEIRTDEERERWLDEQTWYKNEGSEYCKMFEQFEPKEIGRQRYIESIVEGHEPSFGYVVLANLIASNYINTIITTNFDDLVYSACTSYTGIRPIVYAYGVLASEMRVTAERPKVLKLHGDFLYSALKNTDREIAAQDPNMARQLTQILSEYGLVVVGYSGGDDSIMKILSGISDKNDLYWCTTRGEEPNEAVAKLLKEKRGFAVEIAGFDEMMSEIREIVGFDVSKMFGSMQERQDHIIEKIKNFASTYSIDILSEIVDALQNQATQAAAGQQQIKKIQALDLYTKATKALDAGELALSEKLHREVIALTPSDARAHNDLGVTLLRSGRYEEAEKLFRKAIKIFPNYVLGFSNLGIALSRAPATSPATRDEAEASFRTALRLDPKFIDALHGLVLLLRTHQRYGEALKIAERELEVKPQNKSNLITLAAIHKALGDEVNSQACADQVRALLKPDEWYNLACLESVSGNTATAIEHFEKASKQEKFDAAWAELDPDFENIRNDPRFKSIISSQKDPGCARCNF